MAEGILIKPEGALTIDKAAGFHGQLKSALQAGGTLTIDLSAVTELDLPAIQLLYACQQSFRKAGRAMKLAGILREDAVAKLKIAGFVRESINSADQLERQLPDFLAG